MRKRVVALVVLVLLAFGGNTIIAQGLPVPTGTPGEVVFIPFPVTITVDGDLSDWATIPITTLAQDTTLPPHESFAFQLAANETTLYIALTAESTVLTPADSTFELYLNLTTNLEALEYNAGITQLIFAPPIRNSDILTVSGINSERMRIEGVEFVTDQGWGIEAAIPLDRIFVVSECEACEFPPPQDNTPHHGREIGVQAIAHPVAADGTVAEVAWVPLPQTSEIPIPPATFGRGIYYALGESELNLSTSVAQPTSEAPSIDWTSVREALATQPAATDSEAPEN